MGFHDLVFRSCVGLHMCLYAHSTRLHAFFFSRRFLVYLPVCRFLVLKLEDGLMLGMVGLRLVCAMGAWLAGFYTGVCWCSGWCE
jgi:hypothetical protein